MTSGRNSGKLTADTGKIYNKILLSHTCHTEIDETRIFVGIYTIVETWCDRQKTQSLFKKEWCPGADSNHRHADFQSAALPTELPGQIADPVWMGLSEERDPSLVDIAAHKATVQPEFNEKR